jgi:chromosome partitioning protein
MSLSKAVIAVTGRKGGVGKTTICGNLAIEMVSLGYSVRLLDTDPQKSLIAWAGLGDGILSRISEAVDTKHPNQFKVVVEKASRAAQIVIIDTPPGFADPALLSALVADLVLLPVGPSPLDLMAARDALELVREAREQRGGKTPMIRFVPSKLITRTNLSQDLADSLEEMGEPLLPGISQRTVIAEAALYGLTVFEHARSTPARADFSLLAQAIVENLG